MSVCPTCGGRLETGVYQIVCSSCGFAWPKRTHKSTPPETVDWYRKNGVKRTKNGHILRGVVV